MTVVTMRCLGLLSALMALVSAQYELQSTFAGDSFFKNFIFYNSWDPTYGYVHYVDQAFAHQMGMIKTGLGHAVKFGVDTTQYLNPDANLGRLSLRLMSKQSWTHGLFVIDLAHMPANVCGTWPAFWALGSGTWPDNGEIDVIEFTNNVPNNLMSLHTTPGCTVAGADETGILLTADCGVDDGITGCTVSSTTPNNSGAAFNANGGGVYAMEWTSTGIHIWFFPRTGIPPSIKEGIPDTDEFGTPSANFQGSCDIDAHFYNMSLIFDIDFCGAWAGSVWEANGCPMLDPEDSWASCNQFVALNPGAFVDSYWEVNYLKIYQTPLGMVPPPTPPVSSVTPAISTTAVSTALSNAEGRSTTPTMTLAGTVPTDPVGTFSDTSSTLSVLSSPSTENAQSVATTVAATSNSTTLSVQSPPLQITPTTITPALTTSRPAFPPPPTTISPAVATLPPTTNIPPSPSVSCEANVCVSFTTTVVIQTVTIEAGSHPPSVPLVHDREDSRQPLDKPLPLLVCDFTIAPAPSSKPMMTDFTCKSTREQIFNGTLWTEIFTASTAISSGQILKLFNFLEIVDVSMETKSSARLASSGTYTYTGSFTPTDSWIASTIVTAYPVLPTATIRPCSSPTNVRCPTGDNPRGIAA